MQMTPPLTYRGGISLNASLLPGFLPGLQRHLGMGFTAAASPLPILDGFAPTRSAHSGSAGDGDEGENPLPLAAAVTASLDQVFGAAKK